jgi:hypothetical protein
LSKLLGTTTFKDTATSSSSPQAVAETQPPKTTIYVKKPPGWYFSIYIRIDRSRSFHTYPHLGGPFKSLQKVEKAIERYLDDKRHKTLYGFPISFVFFFLLSNFFLLAQFASAHCYFPCDKTI